MYPGGIPRGVKASNNEHLSRLYRPFYVSTEMTNQASPNGLMVHPDTYAASAMCTLGFTRYTYGYWVHGLFGWLGELMSRWFYKLQALYVHPLLWGWLTGSVVDKKKTA